MKKILILAAVFAAAASAVLAQGNGTQVITADEFMERVAASLPELRISNADVLISEQSLYGTGGISDINIETGISYGSTKGYSGYERANDVTFYSEASKKFTSTGTAVAAGMEYSVTSTQYDGYDADGYAPRIYVNVSQPLLRNAMGKLDRFAGSNAALALEIQKVSRSESDAALLSGYRKLYYMWASLEKDLALLAKGIENAEKILQEATRRYENNLSDFDEVEESRSSLISYREQAENVRKSLNSLKAALSPYVDLTGIRSDISQFDSLYEEAMDFEYEEVDFSETRNYRMLGFAMEQAGLSIDYFSDRLRPDLVLSGSVSLKNQADEFGDSAGSGDLDYKIALTLSMPLGDKAGKSEAKIAELQMESLKDEIESARYGYDSGLRSLIEETESAKRMFSLREANISTLRNQYEIQLEKYRQARVEINSIIRADNSIVAEQINIVNLQYGLIENYIEYKHLTGRE